ncbi:MAG: hypothetical protein DRQ02_02980 [Candidatus Latescibacterota bacterium]|nr:MAG: hypothetical protein DRQ02_02980 [Candidatus Latescibacterota bacterium]RKY71409.1 MAG: hypothetical protein DRQ24_07450 [Candidatus Latescibacterota bacterium]
MFTICICAVTPLYASVHDLGTLGHTYPVTERDALEELIERVSRVDWQKVFNREKIKDAIRNYRPDTALLPRAQRERTRLVDMTYTLPFDIPDGKGGILYPRGYTFNPLDYIHFDRTVVVIDGEDPEQVRWFSHSKYAGEIKTMLLLTAGSYFDLAKELNRPVFYATTDIIHRFQLQAVPSVIRQEGRYMEVTEIDVMEK